MFYCQFCTFETVSLTSHLDHHKFHSNITRYYYCGFKKCTKFFQKSIFLTKHLVRAHALMQSKNQRNITKDATYTSDERCKFTCTVDICKKEFDNFAKLVKHLKFHIKKKERTVVIERKIIIFCDDVSQGILISVLTYYVFGICYPKEIEKTLEFIQRVFLNINPTTGGKRSIKSNRRGKTFDTDVFNLAKAALSVFPFVE